MLKLLFALLLIPILSFSQHEFQTEISLGYGFQKRAVFTNQTVDQPHTISSRFGVSYLHNFYKGAYFELGLFGIYHRAHYKNQSLRFNSHRLNMQVPIYLGYEVTDKVKLSAGVGIQNNKNFKEIDFKADNNIRYDLITKLVYGLNDNLQLSIYNNWMISKSPDLYTFNSPKNGIHLGLIYSFKKRKHKNK